MSDANESSTYILPKKVAAMQISFTGDGTTGSAMLSELPEGAQVVVCGDGFNSRTMKVEWQSQSYFVLLQDIEAPDSCESASEKSCSGSRFDQGVASTSKKLIRTSQCKAIRTCRLQ